MAWHEPRWPWFFDDRPFRPEELLRAFAPFFQVARGAGVFPQVNIYDDGTSFLVRAELPGVKKETLDVTAHRDQLTIRGERVIEAPSGEASWHRRECQGGQFRRTVALPQPVDAEQVKATYRNGVLEVVLPRTPETQPRRIEVQ